MDYVKEVAELNPQAVVIDEYDDCIIGISSSWLLVYSQQRILDQLVEREEMTEEDAIEYYAYNIIRSLPHAGEHAPIIVEHECDE
jgi:hypothetical protein